MVMAGGYDLIMHHIRDLFKTRIMKVDAGIQKVCGWGRETNILNFCGVQFSRMASLQSFCGLIFVDASDHVLYTVQSYLFRGSNFRG
jgi:hypothetical protein